MQLTQEERLEEAAVTEQQNLEWLRRFDKLDLERKRKAVRTRKKYPFFSVKVFVLLAIH